MLTYSHLFSHLLSPTLSYCHLLSPIPLTHSHLWLPPALTYSPSPTPQAGQQEAKGFEEFLQESSGKWRLAAFLAGGLMLATSLLSGLLNVLGLSLMGFSPFTACVNLYVFVGGLVTFFLEYKDHPATKGVKQLIRSHLFFLTVPYGRAAFYTLMGSLMMAKGDWVDVGVGGFVAGVGGVVFWSSFKVGVALKALRESEYTREGEWQSIAKTR
jgi:hypothetical protein